VARLERLQARLEKINARIADIETAYPDLVKIKSYSIGLGEIQAAYQEFGSVARKYRALLEEAERLEEAIADLAEVENSATSVAEFRSIS